MDAISLVQDFAVILVISAAAGWLMRRIGLSSVVGYLLAGLIVGPHTPPFALVTDLQRIETASQLGLVFLLFFVGLNLSLERIKRLSLPILAAAAITGGNAFRTMMLTWKYTLPAFLVPLAFTLSPGGTGLLLIEPDARTVWTILTAGGAVGARAAAFGGWRRGPMIPAERIAMGAAGGVLLFGDARLDLLGFATAGLVLVLHSWRCSKASTSETRA